MQRQYIVKMIGNTQTVSLMQVELLYRWLIQQVQLYTQLSTEFLPPSFSRKEVPNVTVT